MDQKVHYDKQFQTGLIEHRDNLFALVLENWWWVKDNGWWIIDNGKRIMYNCIADNGLWIMDKG